MRFTLPTYHEPDFLGEQFKKSPNITVKMVERNGVAPQNYHATTIFPEYYKLDGEWKLLQESRMDCVVTISQTGEMEVTEFRRLKVGDQVVVGRTEDGSDGIYVHTQGFVETTAKQQSFAFRTGRSRETAYSKDYDRLYEMLKFEKDHGYIVWVMGPAVAFDSDSKKALISLVEHGYVHALLAGNALATHDLEGALLKTALGQDIYTQESSPDGHYHHIDIINRARKYPSLPEFVKEEQVTGSIVGSCFKRDIPVVLAGSIRDDGPLPGVISDVYAAQDAMRRHTRKATTVICLATQLHSIATGNMTPSYQVSGDIVRPVYLFNVDISEFAVNKLRDRGTLQVTPIVTNVQDFLVNLSRNLVH